MNEFIQIFINNQKIMLGQNIQPMKIKNLHVVIVGTLYVEKHTVKSYHDWMWRLINMVEEDGEIFYNGIKKEKSEIKKIF